MLWFAGLESPAHEEADYLGYSCVRENAAAVGVPHSDECGYGIFCRTSTFDIPCLIFCGSLPLSQQVVLDSPLAALTIHGCFSVHPKRESK
jgi:hypothetical protein